MVEFDPVTGLIIPPTPKDTTSEFTPKDGSDNAGNTSEPPATSETTSGASTESPKPAALTRREQVLARLQQILAEHGGQESNIPVIKGHEYWVLKNEWQGLNAKE